MPRPRNVTHAFFRRVANSPFAAHDLSGNGQSLAQIGRFEFCGLGLEVSIDPNYWRDRCEAERRLGGGNR